MTEAANMPGPFTVVRAPARPEPVNEPAALLSPEEEARLLAAEMIPPSYDGVEPVANYFGGATPSPETS